MLISYHQHWAPYHTVLYMLKMLSIGYTVLITSFLFLVIRPAQEMMSDDAAIKPTVSELNHKLCNLVDWEEFGLNLPKVSPALIQNIKYDKRGVDEQKPALYYKWLKLYPQATWNDVITALKEIEEHTIVETLTEELHHTSNISLKPTVSQLEEVSVLYLTTHSILMLFMLSYFKPFSV